MVKNSDQIELLRSVVDNLADGVIVVDKQGRLVLTNEAAKRMSLRPLRLGRPMAKQAVEANIRDSAGRPLALDEVPIVRALQGETLADFEIVIKMPDGSDAYLSTSTSPIKDEKGNITGAIGVYRDITDRKRAEERLASLLRRIEAQQRLTLTIVDNVPASIVYVDANFKCLWINELASELLGKRREEVVGRNVFEAIPGAEEQAGEIARRIAASGEARNFSEVAYVLPSGRRVFLDVSLVPVVEGGRTVGVLAMAVDVTEEVEGRQRAEALAENWKALVDAAHSVLQEVSMDRLAQVVVEQAMAVTKTDRVALWLADPARRELRLIAYRNLSPATVEAFRQYTYDTPSLVVRATLTGQLQEVEDMLTLGPEFAATVRAATIEKVRSLIVAPLWARGGIVGVIGLARVEPYRLTAEDRETVASLAEIFASALLNARLYEESGELVRQSQQRAFELEAALTSIADAVFVVDAAGRIKMSNEAARRLMERLERWEELKTLADFAEALRARYLIGDLIPREEFAISKALRGEVVPDMDEVFTDPRTGRDIYLLVSAAPIRDQKGKVLGAVEVMRNITRIREMERLRDEFLSTAAHELKTPVTVLKGYAQALLRAPEVLPPKFSRALEAIDRQSTKINRLVGDLLDISRLMAGRMEMRLETMDLAALVTEVADRMALTTVRHRLNLTVDAHPIVQGDRDRLEQVLINLLDNAIKYSPQGGDIDVRVYKEDGKAVVSVRDYGIGIPREKQAHIFERFYRAHVGTPYDYGGMGVGLYITKEIVTRHGGQIWFESEEGKGSTFYFSLPLAKGEE